MNLAMRIIAVLSLLVSGGASAEVSQTVCVPYSIPVQSTIVECGPGLTGTKYKTLNKICPSGAMKESRDYDTSECHPASTDSNGALTAEARCRLTPGACAKAPTPSNCPVGRKWSLMGSGVAHCVDEDPPCPGGTVNHDWLGHPTNCQTTATRSQSCGAGYTGSIRQRRTVYTWVDGRTTYGSWSTTSDTCKAIPPPEPEPEPTIPNPGGGGTCSPSTSTESAACSGGRPGSMYRQVSTTCPGGPNGSPSTTYGAWNENSCSTVCSPRTETSSAACGSGFTGTKYITTTFACPSGTSTSINEDGCGCANGANNYPTCRLPALPDIPSGCTDIYGSSVRIGVTMGVCDATGSPDGYPSGRTMKCTANGWETANSGNSNRLVDCY